MKVAVLLMGLLVAITFSACKDEEEAQPDNAGFQGRRSGGMFARPGGGMPGSPAGGPPGMRSANAPGMPGGGPGGPGNTAGPGGMMGPGGAGVAGGGRQRMRGILAEPSCENVAKACDSAGYKMGQRGSQKGLVSNCLSPLMIGEEVEGVKVDTADANFEACKAKYQEWQEFRAEMQASGRGMGGGRQGEGGSQRRGGMWGMPPGGDAEGMGDFGDE